MKAELDINGTLWIRAETIVEALYMKKVLSAEDKYQTEGIGYDWNLPEPPDGQ